MKSSQLHGRDVVRWGIVGCGDVTEVKSGPGFQKASGSELVAVMRRDGARAEDYARRHGVSRWYDDAAELIADREVDAVYIATPPDSHAHYAMAALAAGKPVYVEKPMARHTAECERMIAAAQCAEQKLFVAYYRRALPRFCFVKDLLERGTLGRVTGVSWVFRQPGHHKHPEAWRMDAAVAGGGLFVDLGSHVLDLLDHLLGPIHGVAGVAARLASPANVEDCVSMSFFAGRDPGVPGVISCNFACNVREDRIEIGGTEGRAVLSAFGNEPVRLEREGGVELFERPNPAHVAQPLIQTVVDDLLGRGTCPSTGTSARRTAQVIDEVLGGYYGGRDDDFWMRPETWRSTGKPVDSR